MGQLYVAYLPGHVEPTLQELCMCATKALSQRRTSSLVTSRPNIHPAFHSNSHCLGTEPTGLVLREAAFTHTLHLGPAIGAFVLEETAPILMPAHLECLERDKALSILVPFMSAS